MEYAIVIEWADGNYSAYAPDLPGCVSVGDTVEETRQNMQEAIVLHLQGMRNDGGPIPEPRTRVAMIATPHPSAA